MRAVVLHADWDPRPGFQLGSKDIDGKLTYLGSKVWRNPNIIISAKDIPMPGPTEVLVEVKSCGICGSDVHMRQADDDGYILYPGLTAFPSTLGHEFAGVIIEAGADAFNKATGKAFKKGESVCAEEMIWCASCKPCADGFPNHCEKLEELGFSTDGAYAKYIKVDARYCWSIDGIGELFGADRL